MCWAECYRRKTAWSVRAWLVLKQAVPRPALVTWTLKAKQMNWFLGTQQVTRAQGPGLWSSVTVTRPGEHSALGFLLLLAWLRPSAVSSSPQRGGGHVVPGPDLSCQPPHPAPDLLAQRRAGRWRFARSSWVQAALLLWSPSQLLVEASVPLVLSAFLCGCGGVLHTRTGRQDCQWRKLRGQPSDPQAFLEGTPGPRPSSYCIRGSSSAGPLDG